MRARAKPAGPSRYGPVIIVLAALLMVATLPGRTHGLGLITEPLLNDLKVERVAFASINLWATLVGATFCLPIGWAIDRLGLRWVTAGMLVATGASAGLLGAASGAYWPLLLVVTLTRGFGQSALSVCSITSVGKWYRDRSGSAMGAYAILLSVFFVIAFPVMGWAVRTHGWRTAWSALAGTLILIIAPLMMVLLRDAPKATATAADTTATDGVPLAAAIRTPAFWIFAGATAVFGLVSSGLGLFQQAVLEERGFDQKVYHSFLAVTTFLALLGQMACGWLSGRYPIGRLTGVAMLLYALGLGWLPVVRTAPQLWGFATLAGAAGGMITVIFFAVWGQAFGRAHLGRIQASAQMLSVLASAIGPLLFAECHARTGSYSPILLALCPLVLAIGIAAWRVVLPGAGGLSTHGQE